MAIMSRNVSSSSSGSGRRKLLCVVAALKKQNITSIDDLLDVAASLNCDSATLREAWNLVQAHNNPSWRRRLVDMLNERGEWSPCIETWMTFDEARTQLKKTDITSSCSLVYSPVEMWTMHQYHRLGGVLVHAISMLTGESWYVYGDKMAPGGCHTNLPKTRLMSSVMRAEHYHAFRDSESSHQQPTPILKAVAQIVS